MENETRIVMPSVNMLPIQDIKAVLDYNVISSDTQAVGGIEANQIAKAYNGDRDAVRTAYYLADRPAIDYLTIDLDPTEAIAALRQNHQTEVTGLRLELYRLYEILNKQLNASYKPESGYMEDFIDTITVNTKAIVVNAGDFISEIRPERSDFAIANEYIVVDDGDKQYVTRIKNISNQIYLLEGSLSTPAREVTLYKIKGEMLKNTYSFSKTIKDVLSEYAHSVLLGDYAEEAVQAIEYGLATNVTLRSNMFAIDGDREKAVLDSIRVYVTRNTLESTAQLNCKVYLVTNHEGDKALTELIGTSESQEIFNSQWVTFKISNNGQPLEVLKNQQLLIAFECNSKNSYKLMMGRGQGTDLHTNRTIYTREFETDAYIKMPCEYDILLGLNFNGYIEEVTTPYQTGLYTSKVFVNERKDNCLAQLQLKLKNMDKAMVQLYAPIDGYEGFVINKQIIGTGKMVVGNNIATLDRMSNNTIVTKEHIAVYPNDEVYFIPVKAQIIARSELFEDQMIQEVISFEPTRIAGDYLIFECQLPKFVKHFQVQVAYSDSSNPRVAALDSIVASLI